MLMDDSMVTELRRHVKKERQKATESNSTVPMETGLEKQTDTKLCHNNSGVNGRNERREQITKFIRENIAQRQCIRYAINHNSASKACQCGHDITWHTNKGITCDMNKERECWNPETHSQEIPCDSFGEIHFKDFDHGTKNSPYVRLDERTDLDCVGELFTKYWRLSIPNLLISITGGVQLFEINPRLKDILKQGLCHAATSSGAWIITDGTRRGIMQIVGDVVHECAMAHGVEDQKLVVLGIATWGIVANRFALHGKEKGSFPATYAIENIQTEETSASLDPNHTHFILVDNGTVNTYGVEIKFRAALERYIATQLNKEANDNKHVDVPNVLVVVQGGVTTLETVQASVLQTTPVVVIEGTGSAADFISLGFKLSKAKETNADETEFPEHFDKIMKSNAKKMFDWNRQTRTERKEGIRKCTECLHNILKHRRLINIFNLDSSDTNEDIERAILEALIKANRSDAKSQLQLALAWNRCDIAREEIFNTEKHKNWKLPDLYDSMLMALVDDREDFVKLFIENGVEIKTFLTISTLWNLYSKVVGMSNTQAELLRFLIINLKEDWWNNCSNRLHIISRVVVYLLKNDAMHCYSAGTSEEKARKIKNENKFDNPEQDLFIWAVLFNRKKLAALFWQLGKDQLGAALVASAMLKSLSRVAGDKVELELCADLEEHAMLFENYSTELLTECYHLDKKMSHKLLVRELPSWGNVTLFSIANSHGMMDFMKHSSCQTKLNLIWMGRIALNTPVWMLLLCVFIPFPSCLMINFIKKGVEGGKNGHNRIGPTWNNHSDTPFMLQKNEQTKRKTIPIRKQIIYFYSAPIIKFMSNLISYIVFLALFSYFLLTDLRPVDEENSPSVLEMLTWAWVATMIIEKARPFFSEHAYKNTRKVRNWLSVKWNIFDLVMYSMLIVCIILRFNLFSFEFVWALRMYTLSITMFYLRCLQFFFAEKHIGPKVFMIGKMVKDLLYFFVILLVFVFAFGVAYHMNMFPNTPMSWLIVKQVVLLPYFQMFGEFSLQKIEGDDSQECTNNASVWMVDRSRRCPESSELSLVMLTIYMLLTNLLLVNLVIAMFNHTFQSVQDKSLKVWSFHRFSLIYEYFHRPVIVTPIIIINHIYRLIFFVIPTKCSVKRRKKPFKITHTYKANASFGVFEKMATAKYLLRSQNKKTDTQANRTSER